MCLKEKSLVVSEWHLQELGKGSFTADSLSAQWYIYNAQSDSFIIRLL